MVLYSELNQLIVPGPTIDAVYPYDILNITNQSGTGYLAGFSAPYNFNLPGGQSNQIFLTKTSINVYNQPFIVSLVFGNQYVGNVPPAANTTMVPYMGISTSSTGTGTGLSTSTALSNTPGFAVNCSSGAVTRGLGGTATGLTVPSISPVQWYTKYVFIGDGNGNYYFGSGTIGNSVGLITYQAYPTNLTQIVPNTVNSGAFSGATTHYLWVGFSWSNSTASPISVGWQLWGPMA